MPGAPGIRAAIVGTEVGPLPATIDARWLMAYAAGLGETDARYYDTRREPGPAAHPLFPVGYEWPVALALRAATVADALAPLSVHATHHLTIHRPPRAGDRLLTTARVIAVLRRRRGTLVVARFTTLDERGAPVTTTDYGSVYRDVDCDGEAVEPAASVGAWTARHAPAAPAGPPPPPAPRWVETVPLAAGAAHVYTECARIWNPIHTDAAVAAAAGLPAIILHGTATLALAVSRVVAREHGGDAARAHEIAARFTGMVPMPSTLTVTAHAAGEGAVAFEVTGDGGAPVLSDGVLRPRAGRATG